MRLAEISPNPLSLQALPGLRAFQAQHDGREFSILVSHDELTPGEKRWHISVAGRDQKVPDWSTLVEIAHSVRPGVVFVLGLPPRSWWLNLHEGCLHLWETHDDDLIEQWRYEAQGDEPT